MISYEKLKRILAERHITSWTIRKSNKIGQATWRSIQNGGHIDTRTLNALCEMLECQPGDILEYTPDESEE